MKKRYPAYESFDDLFESFDEEVYHVVDNFIDTINKARVVQIAETATTIQDQIKQKGDLGSKFENALVELFDELHPLLKELFAGVYDSLENATVHQMQTDPELHNETYMFALLWLLVSHLYTPEVMKGKLNEDEITLFETFKKNETQHFEAALLLCKQSKNPIVVTYADAFYDFFTGNVNPLPISNLNDAKRRLLAFTKKYKDDDVYVDASSGEDEPDGDAPSGKDKPDGDPSTKKGPRKPSGRDREASPDLNAVFVSTLSSKKSRPYHVKKMNNGSIPADYVPVGQPCLDKDGEILQAFTNRPEDMFPLLVEGTVLLE